MFLQDQCWENYK